MKLLRIIQRHHNRTLAAMRNNRGGVEWLNEGELQNHIAGIDRQMIELQADRMALVDAPERMRRAANAS